MMRSTTISRGRRASRVRERRASRVCDRRGGDWHGGDRLEEGVRCGILPFGDGVLLPPDVPTLIGGGIWPRRGGVQPRRGGDVIAAQVPSYGSDTTCQSLDGGECRRADHDERRARTRTNSTRTRWVLVLQRAQRFQGLYYYLLDYKAVRCKPRRPQLH
jgi:hypothetical protein